MSMDEVLEIGDVFLIHGRGLVIVPIEFQSILPIKHFQPIDTMITVVQAEGTRTKFSAVFSIEHFSFSDGGGSFSLIALLPSASKKDVPDGSCLALDGDTLNLLRSLVNVL